MALRFAFYISVQFAVVCFSQHPNVIARNVKVPPRRRHDEKPVAVVADDAAARDVVTVFAFDDVASLQHGKSAFLDFKISALGEPAIYRRICGLA